MQDNYTITTAGEEEIEAVSFEVVFERNKNRLLGLVMGIVQQQEDAEEIVQDVFVKLYHKKEEMLDNPLLDTWLYRVAINTSLDCLRKKKAERSGGFLQRVFKISKEEIPATYNHPGIQLDKKEDAVLLFAALTKIPEQQKIAFLLQQMEGRQVADVATIMGTSTAAAEGLIKRAKENLRKQLSKDLFST